MGIESAAVALAKLAPNGDTSPDLAARVDPAARVIAAKVLLADFVKVAYMANLSLKLEDGTVRLERGGKAFALRCDEQSGDILLEDQRFNLEYNPIAFRYVGEAGDPSMALDTLVEQLVSTLTYVPPSSGGVFR